MRNKDTILLEGLYDNDISKHISSLREKEKSEKNNEVFSLISDEFNTRANPSDQIFDHLYVVKQNNSIDGLVSYLNENKYWEAKDKLIKILFKYYN